MSVDAEKALRMSMARTIKKYANRRLYDTVASRHVTLDGIRELIVSGVDVKVIDDTSGEDITRSLLLQVIAEQEQSGRPLLDAQLLTRLIRIYGNPLQDFMSEYLLKSVESFVSQQKVFQEQMRNAMQSTPLAAMQEFTARNLEAWQSFQDSMLGGKKSGRRNDPEK